MHTEILEYIYATSCQTGLKDMLSVFLHFSRIHVDEDYVINCYKIATREFNLPYTPYDKAHAYIRYITALWKETPTLCYQTATSPKDIAEKNMKTIQQIMINVHSLMFP